MKAPYRRHLPHLDRSVSEIDPGLHEVMRACVAGHSPWPLFITGAAGTGKTMAALCLLDHCCRLTAYWTLADLLHALNAAQFGRLEWSEGGYGGKTAESQIWERIALSAIVVLDEIGCKGNVTETHYGNVKRVLDERCGKPAIYISNLPLAQIAKPEMYDDRIASRLAAGTVYVTKGPDRRLRK